VTLPVVTLNRNEFTFRRIKQTWVITFWRVTLRGGAEKCTIRVEAFP
jgi:hypothetical protein